MKKKDRSQFIQSKTDRHQLGEQTYSHKPFTVIGSNHNKTEKWPEKIIPRRRHHLCLNDTIRKPNSSCRRPKKVADAIDAATSFIGAAMEKSKPPYLFTVAGEEEEETNLPYHEARHG